MTPPRCEHADCVHACRRAETVRPPCDDPELYAVARGCGQCPPECGVCDEKGHCPEHCQSCDCCGDAGCGGECHDDSPTADDVREGEERAAMAYEREHSVWRLG